MGRTRSTAFAGVLALTACGPTVLEGDCSDATAVATTRVDVVDYRFVPACARVPVGATVVWQNRGEPTHTVTRREAPQFDSGPLGTNGTFELRVTSAGTIDYVCTPHESMGMRGALLVR